MLHKMNTQIIWDRGKAACMTKRRELTRTLVHCINSSLVATMEYFSRDFNRFLATRIIYEYSIPFRLSRLARRESRLARNETRLVTYI